MTALALERRGFSVTSGINATAGAEKALLEKLSGLCDSLYANVEQLHTNLLNVPKDSKDAAEFYSSTIIPNMQEVRKDADMLEVYTAKSYWPYPTYSDLLFY